MSILAYLNWFLIKLKLFGTAKWWSLYTCETISEKFKQKESRDYNINISQSRFQGKKYIKWDNYIIIKGHFMLMKGTITKGINNYVTISVK